MLPANVSEKAVNPVRRQPVSSPGPPDVHTLLSANFLRERKKEESFANSKQRDPSAH